GVLRVPSGAAQLAGAGITTSVAPRLGYINTVHGGKFRRANRLLHLTSKLRCRVIATTGASAFSRAPALRSEPHRDGSLRSAGALLKAEAPVVRSEEHTSELQSRRDLV